MGYLADLLARQSLTEAQEITLRSLRDQFEGILRGDWRTGDPRFYYGGSFGKKTMIRESFDLDLIVYFAPTDQFTVKDFFLGIEQRLRDRQYQLSRHNVALRLPYQGGFHIDIIPGRARDYSYHEANLYASDRDTTKLTSLKTHIDAVRNEGQQDVIKILKLWRLRHSAPIGSFLLELSVHHALVNDRSTDLEDRVWKSLHYLRDSYGSARLVDPANSNNVVSDEVSYLTKAILQRRAADSCTKKTWGEVVW